MIPFLAAGSCLSQSDFKEYSGSYRSGNDVVNVRVVITASHESFTLYNMSVNYFIDDDHPRAKKEWFYFTQAGQQFRVCADSALCNPKLVSGSFNPDGAMVIYSPAFLKPMPDTRTVVLALMPEASDTISFDDGEMEDAPIPLVPADVVEDEIFDFAETEPSFPGGEDAMARYIQEHVVYPEHSREMGEQGVVYVQFIVEKDGSVGHVRVVKGVSELLDAEALRVISGMPDWKPGMQEGKPARVRYTIPINFVIAKEKKKSKKNK